MRRSHRRNPRREGRACSVRPVRLAALAAVAALATSTVVGAPASPAGAVPAEPTIQPTSAEQQTDALPTPSLRWSGCGDGFECATMRVPLDYARPSAGTIDLAVTRLPASDPAHRIGSLVVGAGGPGASGVRSAQNARAVYGPAVLARFDVVGFDPRGVGASTPVRCFATDAERLRFVTSLPFFPVTSAEESTQATAMAGYTRACGQRAGVLLDHVTTADVARDLDLLRRALGDQRLTYHGFSYGSYVGAVYANLYPDRLRAMTLDGVLDPQDWANEPLRTLSDSAAADEEIFDQFAAECAAAGPDRCAVARVGEDGPALRRRLDALLDRLRANPITFPGDPPFTLSYAFVVAATANLMYAPANWPAAAGLLSGVDQLLPAASSPAASSAGSSGGTSSGASAGGTSAGSSAGSSVRASSRRDGLALVTAAVGRAAGGSEVGAADEPYDNGTDAFNAVYCTDNSLPRSAALWPVLARVMELRAPIFSRQWLYSALPCATWPGRSPERYTGPFNRNTSAPLLLVNARFDPATSYVGAMRAAAGFANARLLTIDGFGHTSPRIPSRCAADAIAEYLLAGSFDGPVDDMVPAVGAHCGIDRRPFDPAAAAGVEATTTPGMAAGADGIAPRRW